MSEGLFDAIEPGLYVSKDCADPIVYGVAVARMTDPAYLDEQWRGHEEDNVGGVYDVRVGQATAGLVPAIESPEQVDEPEPNHVFESQWRVVGEEFLDPISGALHRHRCDWGCESTGQLEAHHTGRQWGTSSAHSGISPVACVEEYHGRFLIVQRDERFRVVRGPIGGWEKQTTQA